MFKAVLFACALVPTGGETCFRFEDTRGAYVALDACHDRLKEAAYGIRRNAEKNQIELTELRGVCVKAVGIGDVERDN